MTRQPLLDRKRLRLAAQTTVKIATTSSPERPMGFYNDFILPRLCDLAMRNKQLVPFRERVIGAAEGECSKSASAREGTCRSIVRPLREVLALEPAPRLLTMARSASRATSMPISFLEASAEAIPLDQHSVDTIVTTWTLCSIPQAATALADMRRVLRPSGKLLFVEHGVAPDEGVRRWQDRLTPAWRRYQRWLSPQPSDPLHDRGCRIPHRPH